MMDSYWSKVLNKRMTRRHALGATGMAAGAAAFLAACGGGGSSDSGSQAGPQTSSGISDGYLKKATDGKRGGTMGFLYVDSPNLDILTNALEYAGYGGQYVY